MVQVQPSVNFLELNVLTSYQNININTFIMSLVLFYFCIKIVGLRKMWILLYSLESSWLTLQIWWGMMMRLYQHNHL